MTIDENARKADTTAYDDLHGSNLFRKGYKQGAEKYIALAVRIFLDSQVRDMTYAEFERRLRNG